MGDSRSVSLIVDVTRLTNNTHMEGLIETVRPRTELTAAVRPSTALTAGIGHTAAGQFTPEGPSDSESGCGTKNPHWGMNQTDRPATVETDCANENTAAT
jgi:hypothetical protein